MSDVLYDVVGRSGNIATAVRREEADRLAAVSGATVRETGSSLVGAALPPVSLTADPGDECDCGGC